MSIEWMQAAVEWLLSLWVLLLVAAAPVLVVVFALWVRGDLGERDEW